MAGKKEWPLLIWTYHRVLPRSSDSSIVGEDVFRSQLAYLKDQRYEFIDTRELRAWFAGDLDRSRKYTLLTFDDGWADNWIIATAILQEFKAKATLALNTGLANLGANAKSPRTAADYRFSDTKRSLADGAYRRDNDAFLTIPELIAMKESGVWDIQAHGNTHFGCYGNFDELKGFYPEQFHWTMERALGGPPFHGAPRARFVSELAVPRSLLAEEFKEKLRSAKTRAEREKIVKEFRNPVRRIESNNEFAIRVRSDLTECARKIHLSIGQKPDVLAWPWGQSSGLGEEIAMEVGFDLQLTMNKDAVRSNTPKHRLPRVAAPPSLARFKKQEKVFSRSLLRGVRALYNAARKLAR